MQSNPFLMALGIAGFILFCYGVVWLGATYGWGLSVLIFFTLSAILCTALSKNSSYAQEQGARNLKELLKKKFR